MYARPLDPQLQPKPPAPDMDLFLVSGLCEIHPARLLLLGGVLVRYLYFCMLPATAADAEGWVWNKQFVFAGHKRHK